MSAHRGSQNLPELGSQSDRWVWNPTLATRIVAIIILLAHLVPFSLLFAGQTIEGGLPGFNEYRQPNCERFGLEPGAVPPCQGTEISTPFLCSPANFASSIHQLSVLVQRLHESNLEDMIMDSNLSEKFAIHDYLRMTKGKARMFGIAWRQYIRKVAPRLNETLTSYDSIVSRLNSSSLVDSAAFGLFWRVTNARERQNEEAILKTFETYEEVQRSLGPQNDLVYHIVKSLQEYLIDMTALVSSSELCETVGVNSRELNLWAHFTAIWTRLKSISSSTRTDTTELDECSRRRFIKGRLVDTIQGLTVTIHNLREHLDGLQGYIDNLGQQSLHFLIAGIGRPIPLKHYVDIFSALSRRCSRVRDILGVPIES